MIALLLSTALGGHFTLDMHAASAAKVPVLGWQKSVTQTRAVVQIAEDGQWSHEVCSVEVHDRAPLARTELPEAFIDALPVTKATAEIDGDAMRVDLGLARIGFTEGELPESADADNVIDHEGDGRPGATVRMYITALGTYGLDVVQESHAVLHATRDGEDWKGTIETLLLDQRVLGADHRMLNTSPELRADDDKSQFTLTPTTATSCNEQARLDAAVADEG